MLLLYYAANLVQKLQNRKRIGASFIEVYLNFPHGREYYIMIENHSFNSTMELTFRDLLQFIAMYHKKRVPLLLWNETLSVSLIMTS